MNISHKKINILASCLALSLLSHILFLYTLRMFGTYTFVAPVNHTQAVMVDLAKLRENSAPVDPQKPREASDEGKSPQEEPGEKRHGAQAGKADSPAPTAGPAEHVKLKPADSPTPKKQKIDTPAESSQPASAPLPGAARKAATAPAIAPPLRTAGEFLASKNEKLTYAISLLGLPVGNAELEAKNENGEVRITLRIKSNTAISSLYPVDDVVETRHIAGNFLITKIKQQEGSFKSDIGFTLFLRDKSVFWIDLLKKRSIKESIPTSDVLDTLSGFYYLRNRALQVGTTEMLHIYDSEVYADVPVEVLRREKMRLPNLKEVNTVVVRPLQQTAGIFRRTGEILIWMTDDANKVPVRIVTSIALGKVTADLVSAETTPVDEKAKEK
ncbi:DUF3108 domain-containing protein [Oryzomonas japonica]|uniref:DUF3108 domain-containing protein n=1 Tax=Oryzomonas japonica TaxID=2603858 RepID=A0A7J4ZNI9_9BACT|nr:DUF3108 domain-containing protein [Oryzomonas japonica]KAB0664369.1 DUF3108 domain-containing protein [Oryzomonas japonica]